MGPRDDLVWSQALADRVGCRGLGPWLPSLGAWLGAPSPFPPSAPERFHLAAGRGITVRLHDPDWASGALVDPDAWVLYDVTIAGSLPLPFALDPRVETPTSAAAKLSDDASAAPASLGLGRKVTYFLADLRVVTIAFHAGDIGVKEVKLARLFSWPDWRRRAP